METQLKSNDAFLKGVFLKYMLPSILASVATTAASLIDTVIVARFLGETGLGAMSLISPVYLLYYTIGATIGIGGSIAANISIGRNEYTTYRKIFSCVTVLLLFFSVGTTLLGTLFLDQFAHALGASGDSLALVKGYLAFYIPGGCFTLLAYIPLYFLKIAGKPGASSALSLISGGVNIVLTYWFMSPSVDMGIGGASLATALSMAVTTVCGFYILLTKTAETRFEGQCVSRALIAKICIPGTPSGLKNLLSSTRIIALNYLILSMGAGAYLSTFVVSKNVTDLIGSVMVGLSSAMLSVVGVFFGERDNPSVRNVLKNALKIGTLTVAGLALCIALFPDVLSGLFHITDPTLLAENRFALACVAAGAVFGVINIILSGYFSTTKRVVLSNVLTFLRLLFYAVLPALCLSGVFGVRGIWMSFVLSELCTLLTLLPIIALIRRKRPSLDGYLLDTTQEGVGEISFSVKNRTEDIMYASNEIVTFCDANDVSPKVAMKVSLALEEMLSIIIVKCMDETREQYIDIRIKKFEESLMIRIRNAGKTFDPVTYYEKNKDDEELEDEILGLKILIHQAHLIEFRETFGVNNLLILL